MRAVMISIWPEWCKKIISREKTLEVRKNKPKLETPFKCYIYCTAGRTLVRHPDGGIRLDRRRDALCGKSVNFNMKVIGEFTCDNIDRVDIPYPAYQNELDKKYVEGSCVPYYELHKYAYHDDLYFWHISDLKIYEKPKDITEFTQCHKCEYYPYCRYREYSCDGTYVLHRPPQSWCYVEEVNG